jgi:hypothetical protein
MKNRLLPLFLFCLLSASAHAEPLPVKLTGIINLKDEKYALLETTNSVFGHPDDSGMLKVGQSQFLRSDLRVEVLQIDPSVATVKLNLSFGKTNSISNLFLDDKRATQAGSNTLAPVTIQLRKAHLDQVLNLYGQLTTRTVLHPTLPEINITYDISATNNLGAAQALTTALAKNGLTNILDGTKFIMVLPTDHAAMAHPHSSEIKPSTAAIQSGDINLPNVVLYPVVQIYAELIGRKLDPNAPFPPGIHFITLVNQTPISKSEAVYALDTLFAWQNIKVIPVDKDLVRAVEIKSE